MSSAADNKLFIVLQYKIFNLHYLHIFRTGMPASAICAFKLSEIERVFNGPFKTQASSTSIWTQATSVPTPRPGQVRVIFLKSLLID